MPLLWDDWWRTRVELFPRDEEIVLPSPKPKPREAGGFVAPSQRVLALAWFLTYVFPVYVPVLKRNRSVSKMIICASR